MFLLERAALALAVLTHLTACGGQGSSTPDPSPTVGTSGAVLEPPAAGEGLQIVTPDFTLHPGDEAFKCFYTTIPTDSDVAVGKFVSKMATGSHHFILYQMDQATQPDGTMLDCGGGVGVGIVAGGALSNPPLWVYAASRADAQMEMPAGVGMPFKARQPVLLNMHYFNTGSTDLTAHVALNVEFARGEVQTAGSFVSFNTQIDVPPGGAQTVSGHCQPPAGAQFFLMSTHTHSHAVDARIDRYSNGQVGEQLVQTTDWEHPTVERYDAPFVTFAPGEELFYSCSYENASDRTLTMGESATENEMCMAVTYYFPATGRSLCF